MNERYPVLKPLCPDNIVDLDGERIKPCLACMAPNLESATVCLECGSPFGTASVLRPFEVVAPDGPRRRNRVHYGYTRRNTKFVELFTTWLLSLMVLPIIGFAIYELLPPSDGFWSVVGACVMLTLAFAIAKSCFLVTRGYLRTRSRGA